MAISQLQCYPSLIENVYLKLPLLGPSKPKVNIPAKPKMIEAQDRSPITMTIGDNVTALTNTSVTIQCHTSGVPAPTVTWTKDGHEISDDGKYTVQADDSLLINNANVEDSARYMCTADSPVGQDSASSTVQIVGKYSKNTPCQPANKQDSLLAG